MSVANFVLAYDTSTTYSIEGSLQFRGIFCFRGRIGSEFEYDLAYALMIGSFEELRAESKRNNTERYVLQVRELPND